MSESTQSSTQSKHRVPTFYCCYFLQSICKRSSFYVGSTPDPVRRLRQHNGILNRGGAYRTRREGTRPWEMDFVVYGFPNKIAALQFEHAWQHGYSTHYISPKDRIVQHKNAGRSIHHKLGVVRQLLLHPYFIRMDLTVHFFNTFTKSLWDQNKFKISDDNHATVEISDNALDMPTFKDTERILNHAEENLKMVEMLLKNKIDIENTKCELYKKRLTYGHIPCDICKEEFDYTSEDHSMHPYIAFCLDENCNFVSHLKCLYRYFLDEEQLHTPNPILIPKSGKCPSCNIILPWTRVVRYSTLMKSQLNP